MNWIQVFTTTNSKEEALKIANALINKRLAACVQLVGPITSVYSWKGKNGTAKEWLCIIKSKKPLYPRIEKMIKSIHTYSLPEITTFKIEGSKEYLAWIEKATK